MPPRRPRARRRNYRWRSATVLRRYCSPIYVLFLEASIVSRETRAVSSHREELPALLALAVGDSPDPLQLAHYSPCHDSSSAGPALHSHPRILARLVRQRHGAGPLMSTIPAGLHEHPSPSQQEIGRATAFCVAESGSSFTLLKRLLPPHRQPPRQSAKGRGHRRHTPHQF